MALNADLVNYSTDETMQGRVPVIVGLPAGLEASVLTSSARFGQGFHAFQHVSRARVQTKGPFEVCLLSKIIIIP